jgi:parvulin-like peptidyl-prolyl isomerase
VTRPDRVGSWMLAMGAAAGIAMAGWALVERRPVAGDLPPEVVAVVDGHPITHREYERAVRAVAADRAAAPSPADRRRVLDRLIEEELLVQHGLELGLAAKDRRVRADLSASVITLVTAGADAEAAEVTDAELEAFFETHRDWFRTAPRLQVRQLFFRVGGDGDALARKRAAEALARWQAGQGHATLAQDADPYDVPLPDGPLALAKLQDYLGPTVVRGLAGAAQGDVVGPLRSSNGYHVLEVLRRDPGTVPPFAQVRDQVRAEHRRQLGEQRLRSLLQTRRATADVRVNAERL